MAAQELAPPRQPHTQQVTNPETSPHPTPNPEYTATLLHVHCITAYALHLHCVHTASTLHPHCIYTEAGSAAPRGLDARRRLVGPRPHGALTLCVPLGFVLRV